MLPEFRLSLIPYNDADQLKARNKKSDTYMGYSLKSTLPVGISFASIPTVINK
jgi:hypothetical protein